MLLCAFDVWSDSDDDEVAAVVMEVFVEGGLVPRGVPARDTDLELAVDMCDLLQGRASSNELGKC